MSKKDKKQAFFVNNQRVDEYCFLKTFIVLTLDLKEMGRARS